MSSAICFKLLRGIASNKSLNHYTSNSFDDVAFKASFLPFVSNGDRDLLPNGLPLMHRPSHSPTPPCSVKLFSVPEASWPTFKITGLLWIPLLLVWFFCISYQHN